MKLTFTLFLATAPLVNSYSYAHDHSQHCHDWAQNGFCHNNDKANRTQELCPVSCGGLPVLVDDSDNSCPQWAAAGECERNPITLSEKCPLACGHASNLCVDLYEDCASWKHEGRCDKDYDFMSLNCAKSCICSRRCIDKEKDCGSWAEDDMCNTNPAFMLKTCPMSCNVCISPTTSLIDEDLAKCSVWSRNGECDANPHNVVTTCPSSCGAGAVVCGDVAGYDECKGWRKEGRCTDEYDKVFMRSNCAATCGVCSRLERHYDSVIGAGFDHEEL